MLPMDFENIKCPCPGKLNWSRILYEEGSSWFKYRDLWPSTAKQRWVSGDSRWAADVTDCFKSVNALRQVARGTSTVAKGIWALCMIPSTHLFLSPPTYKCPQSHTLWSGSGSQPITLRLWGVVLTDPAEGFRTSLSSWSLDLASP